MTLLLVRSIAFLLAMLGAGYAGYRLGWFRRGERFKLVEEQLRLRVIAAEREARKAEARAMLAEGELDWLKTAMVRVGDPVKFGRRRR